jgi:coenzyme F420-reducing hydrogenase gamma subunit
MTNKIKIGWFSFTCCEDSTIIFTELLNTHYREWLPKIEFVHGRILRKDDTGEMKEMDIAFVEGAISSHTQEEKIKKIRQKSRILIAVGSCAITGSPSNQRNFFNQVQSKEIKPILEKFKYKEKVLRVSEVVQVDEEIPGCPMDEKKFLDTINKFLNPTS